VTYKPLDGVALGGMGVGCFHGFSEEEITVCGPVLRG
jgi:hypothetical protein